MSPGVVPRVADGGCCGELSLFADPERANPAAAAAVPAVSSLGVLQGMRTDHALGLKRHVDTFLLLLCLHCLMNTSFFRSIRSSNNIYWLHIEEFQPDGLGSAY